jgi:hypothetical protein
MTATRPKSGGRPKSTALSEGKLPLDYMLEVMRDPNADPKRRDKMAEVLAPYFHSKRAVIEHTGKDGQPIQINILPQMAKW